MKHLGSLEPGQSLMAQQEIRHNNLLNRSLELVGEEVS